MSVPLSDLFSASEAGENVPEYRKRFPRTGIFLNCIEPVTAGAFFYFTER